ncbi:TetR/AcrR family transcriptional regulator [Catenulispora sp. NL8]|uniref:TetR/AcrR family transcriptional regulator n=1 Tax=Catenulispora pinistramenti TaxID=2705254 RepID=A0ABS5KVN8_9ACTN|nr:TetR/AcrR family transcriptional regulator [Catenulispora pinistramenti]MBS2550132.1 TetR/AcrR family transcriptional regulator [Catenulispora pinistramenti]
MNAAKSPAPSIRARVRAEMIGEIKRVALEHLERDGSALSLRAVARDMGMVSSAIYRYFPSRDELLTALIIDAYNSLGEAVERADGDVDRRDAYLSRWFAVCHTVRRWAIARPAEYALIYGSPIPGYKAPDETIEPGAWAMIAMAQCVREAEAAGKLHAPEGIAPLPPTENSAYAQELRITAIGMGFTEDSRALEPFLSALTMVFGAVNFEVFGRLNRVFTERGEWYDRQVRDMAVWIGLGPR